MAYAGPSRPVARPKRHSTPRPASRATGATASSAPDTPAVRSRGVSFAAGIVAGAAIGAAIALLLAPDSGAVTRSRLRQGGRRGARRAELAWDDLRLELDRAWKLHRKRRQLEKAAAEVVP